MQFNNIFFRAPKQEYDEKSLGPYLIYVTKGQRKIPCFLHNESSSFWILFFHGNSQDLYRSAQFLQNLQVAMDINFNYMIVEYPGYGIYKDIEPTEDIIYEDACAAYDFLRDKQKNSQIFIMGRSIGTGPACYLGSLNKGQGIILISAFASLQKIAYEKVSFLGKFVKDRFKNAELAKNITLPVLLIHGRADDKINYSQSIEIYENLRSVFRNFHLSENMTHNTFDMVLDISQPLIDFINLINSK